MKRNGNSLYILLSYSYVRQNDLTYVNYYTFTTTICSLICQESSQLPNTSSA